MIAIAFRSGFALRLVGQRVAGALLHALLEGRRSAKN